MKKLTILKNKEAVVCSADLAEGFEVEHRALRQLIKRHEKKLKKYGKVTFQMQPSESGQKQSVTYLNEKQALLIMTYTRSNDATDYFRMKLIDDFSKQKELLQKVFNPNWQNVRKDGRVVYFQKTNIIKQFVEYATNQGSKNAKMYYMNLAKMENNALFFFEQKYPNLREVMTIKQLMQVATADQIIEKCLIDGMKNGVYYKDIYKIAKEKVTEFSKIIGQSPILGLEDKGE